MKIAKYEYWGNFLAILESYLNDWKQYVKIGQSQSTMLDVTSGVLQGLLLRPLICIIYINDITENVNSFALWYADDYNFLSINNETIKNDISQLQIWCKQNHMSLNADKCNMLNFQGNQKTEVCKKEVKFEENQKDLGLIVTQKMSWLENAKRRVTKATKLLFFVKRNVSSKTSIKAKINCYTGCVVPILTYGSQSVYYNKSELKIIENVQSRAMSWIYGYNSCNKICHKIENG